MNKNEFVAKRAEIVAKIDSLKHELHELRNEYIKSVYSYPVGTKVRVTYSVIKGSKPEEYIGFIMSYKIHFATGDVLPVLAQAKKDGTPSKRKHFIVMGWYNPTFEVIK